MQVNFKIMPPGVQYMLYQNTCIFCFSVDYSGFKIKEVKTIPIMWHSKPFLSCFWPKLDPNVAPKHRNGELNSPFLVQSHKNNHILSFLTQIESKFWQQFPTGLLFSYKLLLPCSLNQDVLTNYLFKHFNFIPQA